jgi:hypothetical protein
VKACSPWSISGGEEKKVMENDRRKRERKKA